jgi:hypothetical protein
MSEGGSVLGPEGPRLLAEKCSTCIFRPGNRMSLRTGRVKQMVNDSISGGGFITCHKTLDYGEHPDAGAAICRGFFDAYGPMSNVIRIYERLGGFDEVSEPKSTSDG